MKIATLLAALLLLPLATGCGASATYTAGRLVIKLPLMLDASSVDKP